jgi:hypothetical protein
LHGLLRGFIEQFDPEPTESCLEKAGKVGHSRLGSGVEDGVTATDVGPDGVSFTDAVTDNDAVAITGAAAGEVVFALR